MTPSLSVFAGSAVAIGFVHTAMGIDHTLPFLVLGRAQKWSLRKILGLTTLCGIAHVMSSVFIGLFGAALGVGVQKWEIFQVWRGHLAAWSLIIFGLTYAVWSFAKSRRLQGHLHDHGDGHVHAHEPEMAHDSLDGADKRRLITTWSLVIIFVLGPCEPLVPLIIVPALHSGWWTAIQVAIIFGATTVGTMVAIVMVGYYGINLLPLRSLQIHANTLAGLAVAVSGVAIQLFGI